MANFRYPAVADMFYPADPNELRNTVLNMLSYAQDDYQVPKAIISPHAGYIYSGEVAANAYSVLAKVSENVRRVVIIGPAHHYPFHGVAVSDADYFLTPLGQVAVDQDALAKIINLQHVSVLNEAHLYEHAIEVQLPFLQVLLKDFTIVPLLAGMLPVEYVTKVLDTLWGGPETLIVISSDLSHYHSYEKAKLLDNDVANAIINLDADSVHDEQACGSLSIKALIQMAKIKKLRAVAIDMRNSGDTAGSKDKVVGYGAFHFIEQP